MPNAPMKVVLDCSSQSGLTESIPAILEQAAEAARAGDAGLTSELLALARERADAAASETATETIVELDAGEIAQRDVDAVAHLANLETSKERAMAELRTKRDRLLAQTDAFFITPLPSDYPADKVKEIQSNLAAWKTFRQALRDLPGITDDPFAPEWPAQPAAPQIYLT